jgi:hypothetical protein
MSNVILEAKTIGDIKGNFIVPKYQRGYRWTESQVTTMMNDLWENCKQETQKEYCLQPVVVRKRGEADYELIDGQQRFTTILILLLYVKQRFTDMMDVKFSLEYETRVATAEFLANISEEKAQENIDFFHIYNARKCIENWLDDTIGNDNSKKSRALWELFDYLTEKVKVIWYEVGDDEDPVALFTRLNIGRIKLTNAELVKARLLIKSEDDNQKDMRQERAIQWDNIEKELSGDKNELWYFLTTKAASAYPTRIELLFDMMAGKAPGEREEHFTFFWFEKEIMAHGVTKIWEEIQQCFLQIKEWYTDNILYHKIGYLISSASKTMAEIFQLAQGKRKSAFISELDGMIAESINFKLKDGETYRDLDYRGHYDEISRFLLLFNVESIIKEDVYQRFPFSKYNTLEWSLEHIHAQNSQGLKTRETQLLWIKKHIDSVKSVSEDGKYDDLIQKMEDVVRTGNTNARGSFDDLANKITNALSEDTKYDYIDTLSNMALLSKDNNSALNNYTFDVKRNMIVDMDRRGAFIPYCTKMVFLKYYTPSGENQIHFWGQKDREAYIKAMENMLHPYLERINKTF